MLVLMPPVGLLEGDMVLECGPLHEIAGVWGEGLLSGR